MELEVIEPIRTPLKTFKSREEFEVFAQKHREEMDKQTTHKLNKLYAIEGYKVTKIRGKLCLKPRRETLDAEQWVTVEGFDGFKRNLNERLDELDEALNEGVSREGFEGFKRNVQAQFEQCFNKLNEVVCMVNALRE
jgi:DNA polymerase II small subunit/DNA polymerase delta subunit B